MKKIIFALWVVSLGLSNVAWSAACATSGATTVFPTGASGYAQRCDVEPDYFAVKIYKMMLCTSAPVAPTTAAVAGTTTCQTVFTNATGSTVSIASGASSPLTGTATRPDNGTYTHAFVEMSNVLVIGDSREYSIALDGWNIDASTENGGGVFCATTALGSKCGATAITAVNYSSALGDLNGDTAGYINQLTDIANAVGTSSVYLVDSTYLLEADTAADVIYLVGMQAFTTPIVITDDTVSMDVAFTSSTGMSVFDANADDVYVTTGPFALKMTTK